jgi:hypothetical protein
VVKRRLSLLLLLGALLGLFGQGMALAAGPTLAPTVEASHTMPAGMDCSEMAAPQKQSPKQPCKGLTLACIAQMGCTIPMTFEEPRPLTEHAYAPRLAASWPTSPVLAGLDVAPEPEPPTV